MRLLERRQGMNRRTCLCAALLLTVGACGSREEPQGGPATSEPAAAASPGASEAGAQPLTDDREDAAVFSAIAPDETVRFTGTEPFWGGQVAGTALTYSTPEIPDGTDIAVTRFAGRGGVSWSGTYSAARFALAVTPGECSDGMSDRTYPFVATLEVAGEQRRGCAWTERRPFTGSPNP